MLKDSQKRYGRITQAFHWIVAILIFLQIGKLADRINNEENWVSETIVPWHSSVGTLLLLLVFLRIVWVLSQHKQRPEPDSKLAAWGHFLLYASMFAMPLTGVLGSLGGGRGVKAFGVQLVDKGPEIPWADAVSELHSPLAWLLTALIIGHIAAALYHHFVKRDESFKRIVN